jgi:hypothetical protein
MNRPREDFSSGNSAGRQRVLGEYHERANELSNRYYEAVCAGAITLRQAIYALTHDLQKEWRKALGREA